VATDDRPDADTVIAQALVPYGRMPAPADVAVLTDQLITHGQQAIARVQALGEADRAAFTNSLRDWEYLTAAGPTGTTASVANWSYARALARVVRSLTAGLRAAT